MASKGCKCVDGSYRRSCCRSTKRSNKARTKSSSNKNPRGRDGGRDGDPISVVLERLERRGKIYAYGSVIAGGLYGAAMVTEAVSEVQFAKASYGYHRGYGSGLSRYAAGGKAANVKYARRMRMARRAATTGRIVGKVAARGIPIVGTALLAYDAYTVVDWALGGRLPYGARDRR